jgi:hypothetical protein
MKMNKERAEELLGVINRGAAIPSLQWLERCKEALEYVIEHEDIPHKCVDCIEYSYLQHECGAVRCNR